MTTPTKKPTPTQLRKELEDLQRVSAARMTRVRDLEVQAQKARNILKSEGTTGLTLQQDHYRLAQMVGELRKLLDVKPEEISGG